MKLARRRNWLAVIVGVAGMLAIGAGLPGCSPQDGGKVDEAADDAQSDANADTDEVTADVAETEANEAPPMPADPDLTGPALGDPLTAEPEAASPEVTEPEATEPEATEPEATEPEATEPEATEPAAEAAAADGKISSYAPAADLIGQVEYYVERVGKSLKEEGEYEENEERISKDANTIVVLALALGMHDEDNKYKIAAPAMLKAAQDLAKTKDHAAATAAAVALVAAACGKEPVEAELKWENVVSLPCIKEQMSGINSNLKRYAKRKKFKNCAEYSALIAVVGQAIIANGDEVATPDKLEQWNTYCIQMRDAAAAVNKAMHAEDEEAAAAAMGELAKRCDACHEVFNPDDDEEEEGGE